MEQQVEAALSIIPEIERDAKEAFKSFAFIHRSNSFVQRRKHVGRDEFILRFHRGLHLFERHQVDAFDQEKRVAQLRQLPILETDHLSFSEFTDFHALMVHHG